MTIATCRQNRRKYRQKTFCFDSGLKIFCLSDNFLNYPTSSSSEKASVSQLGLFNEAEAIEEEIDTVEDTVTVQSHTRQKKPRVSIPPDLPREDIIYDLRGSEKVCPHDGTELKYIGSDDHE